MTRGAEAGAPGRGPRGAWRVARRAACRLAAALAGTVLAAGGAWADAGPAPCRVPGVAHELLCGRVTRPLDPATPAGRTLGIHYAVAPALARRRLPDPVFLLAGGPGQSAIAVAPQMLPLFARLNQRRDIVFVDLRGTGRSAPLACEPPRRPPLGDSGDPAAQAALLRDCRAALLALPHVRDADDLRFFTTTLAMQDVDAVRQRLGAERIDLVGVSYGTRAALEYQRQFPQRVRRSVLDGVAPPDMALPASASTDAQAAFDAMVDACAGTPDCARRYPGLREDWRALLAGLPRPVTLADPLTGRAETLTLTRELLLGAVRAPLYVPALASALPHALTEAARGRFEALAGLNSVLAPRAGAERLAMGLHFAVACAEDVPLVAAATDPPGRDFGDTFARLYARACADWPRGTVPAAFRHVGPSATPVLLLSGALDPATPPRHGERVARALGAQARHVVVPNVGHGVLALGCLGEVLFRFIDAVDDGEARAVDARCVEALPPPPAYRPPTPEPAEAAR